MSTNLFKKITPFFISWRSFFLFFLTSIVFFIFYQSLFALVSTCRMSTVFPSNSHEGALSFSLSSTTNGMVGNGFLQGVYIICSAEGNFVINTVSTTTGCGTSQIPLFDTSSSTDISGHIEDPSVGKYSKLQCLQYDNTLFNYATITSQLNNCNGYGTTLFSAPAYFTTTGNAHIGDANAYPMKRCMTLQFVQSISVTFSSQTVGFGTLSPSQTKYATSNGLGTTTPFTATSSSFYIDVNVIGNSSYSIALSGATLTNQNDPTKTISKIGGTPVALSTGIEQFGISALTECLNPGSYGCMYTGATSTIVFPYNTANYAYNGDTNVTTQLATGPQDDGVTSYGGSRYYVRMAANIANLTPAGTYSTGLTVIVTPQF